MSFRILSRRSFVAASAAGVTIPALVSSARTVAVPGNAAGSGADLTATVQEAIDTLGERGGTVVISEGVRFDLKALRLSPRVNLEYRIDDESQRDIPTQRRGSGERVFFSANSSWPGQRTGGAVNEWRFSAPYYPGVVVDVRKDVGGADAGLAPNQSRTEVARAGFLIDDSQVSRWRTVYENWGDEYSTLSGVRIHTFRNRIELIGVGGSAWQVAPRLSDRIVGEQSRAVGFVRGIDRDRLVLEWLDGAFMAGERLRNEIAGTRSSRPVDVIRFDETENAGIGLDLWHGTVTVGGGNPGVATEALQTYGNLKLVPTRSSSVNRVREVLKPTLVFGGNPEAANPHQLGIQYDPAAKTDATRRLIAVPADLEEWRGEYCPVSAMVSFGMDHGIGPNAVNVARINQLEPGRWQIVFTHPLRSASWISADPSVGGAGSRGWSAKVVERSREDCVIEAYRPDGDRADMSAGLWLSLLILGGDV